MEAGEETRDADSEHLTFESLFSTMEEFYGAVIQPPNAADAAKYKKYYFFLLSVKF